MNREYYTRYWIKNMLKDIIRCAKQGNHACFDAYTDQLQGMLFYMESVGDISNETYNRIVKLKHLIHKKYSRNFIW